jgi:hypothetical protein
MQPKGVLGTARGGSGPAREMANRQGRRRRGGPRRIRRRDPPARRSGHFAGLNLLGRSLGYVAIDPPAWRDFGGRNWPFVWLRCPLARLGGRRSGQGRTPRKSSVQRRSNPCVRWASERRSPSALPIRVTGLLALAPTGLPPAEHVSLHWDEAAVGVVSESPGRNARERRGGPESANSGGRAHGFGAKAAGSVEGWPARRTPPAGWERQHGDQDTSSNWRSPPRPAAKAAESGRPHNRRTREVGRRREGGGRVRSSDEAG